jgi:hypothetical protein
LHFSEHLPSTQVHLSPQHFLQSKSLLLPSPHFADLHLQTSLQVQIPSASLQVQDASQVHLPSAATQLTALAWLFFIEHDFSQDGPADTDTVKEKRTTRTIVRIRMIISFLIYFIFNSNFYNSNAVCNVRLIIPD